MTERWFGASWGAPCCEAEAHAPTPVGRPCMRCKEPIREGDQGLIRAVALEVVAGTIRSAMMPMHLDCVLRSIRPHGPECPYCRGAERIDHDAECGYRVRGDLCSCRPMPAGKAPPRG